MTTTWKKELLSSYTASNALNADSVSVPYKTRIPQYYLNLIDWDHVDTCPIALQALPNLQEKDPELPEWAQQLSQNTFGRRVPWTEDAIGDRVHLKTKKLTHRYANRALLHVTSMCAMYCRFCFRKDHINNPSIYEGEFKESLKYLEQHNEIKELILTGGDPLSMTDAWFESFFTQLKNISHLKIIRIHSRMPVTLPSRITEDLLNVFRKSDLNLALVSHFNHPKELTSASLSALKQLRNAGVQLFNQSVLLNKINNNIEVLAHLFQSLYENGVRPFYLHHPDWTVGTFHFRSSIEDGKKLMQKLQGLISGPAMPRYMLDIPHGYGKIDLMNKGSIQPILISGAHNDDRYGAELYEVTSPESQPQFSNQKKRYLNLWRKAPL